MSAIAVNSLMQAIAKNQPFTPATKMPIMDRTHYSGPSSSGGHSHGHSHGSGKHSIALTALTLLAFLFFLNILQNCLDEHMESMNPEQQQQIIILKQKLKNAKEAEKRKSDEDVLLVNTSSKAKEDVQSTWKKETEMSTAKNNYGNIKKLTKYYEIKKP